MFELDSSSRDTGPTIILPDGCLFWVVISRPFPVNNEGRTIVGLYIIMKNIRDRCRNSAVLSCPRFSA